MNPTATIDQFESSAPAFSPSRAARWSGRVISGLLAAFLLLDAIMKLVQPAPVLQASAQLGLSARVVAVLGVVLLASTLLHLFRRTAVLGAILLTGYLGGAVAANLHVDRGWFPLLFPFCFGVLLWVGFALRDPRVRELLRL